MVDLEIYREDLLERLDRSRPRVVAVIAPAGFGKTTLVRQYARNRSCYAVCDCTQLANELDLSRRVVPALADEAPERGTALAQTELLLADGTTEMRYRIDLALAAWRAPSCNSTFVFENAEFLATAPSAHAFFIRLMANCPDTRTVIICARDSLRLQYSRFVPPHLIASVGPLDLAFTRDEVERILLSSGASRRALDRAISVSQGWPIGVLLLARFAAEGRLDELLERLEDVAFEELHAYLASEIVGDLHDDVRQALFACACIPNATRQDVLISVGSEAAAQRFSDFEKTSPFVARMRDDTYSLHPLISSMLLESGRARRDALLSSTAATYEAGGDFVRAAELHLSRPDQLQAARVLELEPIGDEPAPSMRYSRVLASLDRHIVQRHPTLWCTSALFQMYFTDSARVLAESSMLVRGFTHETPLKIKLYVLAIRVHFMSYLGMFAEALETIDAFVPRAAIPETTSARFHGYLLYYRGYITARLGDLESAQHDLARAWPLVNFMNAMAAALLMVEGADIARARGERNRERALLEQSVDIARRAELPNLTALRMSEAAFGAWLAGETELYHRFAVEIATLVSERGIRGFAFFSSCLRGRDAATDELDSLRWIICGHLIATVDAHERADALRHARAALATARQYSAPFLIALAALACASLAEGPERAARQSEAAAAAALVTSEALRAAVEAANGGKLDCGFLTPFVLRLGTRRARPAGSFEIQLQRGRVVSGGSELSLSNRELAIVFALAIRRETVSPATLADLIWPELDGVAARNALHVSVHRLRQRLGRQDAIVRNHDGYRLGDSVCVDLWEAERLIDDLRGKALSAEQYRALAAAFEALRAERPPRIGAWDWFASLDRRVAEWRCEAAQRLAAYALERRRTAEALEFARDVLTYDSCDEAANEIVIRAHLEAGNRAAALRHFDSYRNALLRELDCEPSPSLERLIATEVSTATAP